MSKEWYFFFYFYSFKGQFVELLFFLIFLQVIEYIQFLREKVHKFEGSYQGWNTEPTKLMRWVSSCSNINVVCKMCKHIPFKVSWFLLLFIAN